MADKPREQAWQVAASLHPPAGDFSSRAAAPVPESLGQAGEQDEDAE